MAGFDAVRCLSASEGVLIGVLNVFYQEGADKILFKKCDAYEGKNLLEMESKGLTQFPMIFVSIDGQGMGSLCVFVCACVCARRLLAR